MFFSPVVQLTYTKVTPESSAASFDTTLGYRGWTLFSIIISNQPHNYVFCTFVVLLVSGSTTQKDRILINTGYFDTRCLDYCNCVLGVMGSANFIQDHTRKGLRALRPQIRGGSFAAR